MIIEGVQNAHPVIIFVLLLLLNGSQHRGEPPPLRAVSGRMLPFIGCGHPDDDYLIFRWTRKLLLLPLCSFFDGVSLLSLSREPHTKIERFSDISNDMIANLAQRSSVAFFLRGAFGARWRFQMVPGVTHLCWKRPNFVFFFLLFFLLLLPPFIKILLFLLFFPYLGLSLFLLFGTFRHS